MKVQTTRTRIREVITRWRRMHAAGANDPAGVFDRFWTPRIGLDPETATTEDVAVIVGNDSRTALRCAECNKETARLATFEDPDGAGSVDLCEACLRSALDALAGAK